MTPQQLQEQIQQGGLLRVFFGLPGTDLTLKCQSLLAQHDIPHVWMDLELYPELIRDYQIRSTPLMKIFNQGQLVAIHKYPWNLEKL